MYENTMDMIARFCQQTGHAPAKIVLGHRVQGDALLASLPPSAMTYRAFNSLNSNLSVYENGVECREMMLNGVRIVWPVRGGFYDG